MDIYPVNPNLNHILMTRLFYHSFFIKFSPKYGRHKQSLQYDQTEVRQKLNTIINETIAERHESSKDALSDELPLSRPLYGEWMLFLD